MVPPTRRLLALLLHILTIFQVQTQRPPRLNGPPWGPIPAAVYSTHQDIATDFASVFGDRFEVPLSRQKNIYIAGFDNEIYKLRDDIALESVRNEIRVTFYLWTHQGFQFITTLNTDYETLKRNINKYHHYFQLKKVYIERFTKKKEWRIDRLIMLPSTFPDDIVLTKFGHPGELTAVVEDPSTVILREEYVADHPDAVYQPNSKLLTEDEDIDVLLDIYKQITGLNDQQIKKQETKVANNNTFATEVFSSNSYKDLTEDNKKPLGKICYKPEEIRSSDNVYESIATPGSVIEYDSKIDYNRQTSIPIEYAKTETAGDNVSPVLFSEYTQKINPSLANVSPGPSYLAIQNESKIKPKVIEITADIHPYSFYKTNGDSSISIDQYNDINQEVCSDKSIQIENNDKLNYMNSYSNIKISEVNSQPNTEPKIVEINANIRPCSYSKTSVHPNISFKQYDLVDPEKHVSSILMQPIEDSKIQLENPLVYREIEEKYSPHREYHITYSPIQSKFTTTAKGSCEYNPIITESTVAYSQNRVIYPLKYMELETKYNPNPVNQKAYDQTVQKSTDFIENYPKYESTEYPIEKSKIQIEEPEGYCKMYTEYNPKVTNQVAYSQTKDNPIFYSQTPKQQPAEYTEYHRTYPLPAENTIDYSEVQASKNTPPPYKTFNYQAQKQSPLQYNQHQEPIEHTKITDNTVHYSDMKQPIKYNGIQEEIPITYDPILTRRPTEVNPNEADRSMRFNQIQRQNQVEYRGISIQKPVEYGHNQKQKPIEYNDASTQIPIEYNYVYTQRPIEYNNIETQNSIEFNKIQTQIPIEYSHVYAQRPVKYNQVRTLKPVESQNPNNKIEHSQMKIQQSLGYCYIQSQKPIELGNIQRQNPIEYNYIETQNPREFNQIQNQIPIEYLYTQRPIKYSHVKIQKPLEEKSYGHTQRPIENNYFIKQKPIKYKYIQVQNPMEYRQSQNALEYIHTNTQNPIEYNQVLPMEYNHIQSQVPIENRTKTPKYTKPIEFNQSQGPVEICHIQTQKPLEYTQILAQKPIQYNYIKNQQPLEYNQIETQKPESIQTQKPIEYNQIQYIPTQNPIQNSQITTLRPMQYSQAEAKLPIVYNHMKAGIPIERPVEHTEFETVKSRVHNGIKNELGNIQNGPKEYSGVQVGESIQHYPKAETSPICGDLIKKLPDFIKNDKMTESLIIYTQPENTQDADKTIEYNEPLQKLGEYSQIIAKPIAYSKAQIKIPENVITYTQPPKILVNYDQMEETPIKYSQPSQDSVEYNQRKAKPTGHSQDRIQIPENVIGYPQPKEILDKYKQVAEETAEYNQPLQKPFGYEQIIEKPIANNVKMTTPENLVEYNQLPKYEAKFRQILENPIDNNEFLYQEIKENSIKNINTGQIFNKILNSVDSSSQLYTKGEYPTLYNHPKIKNLENLIEYTQSRNSQPHPIEIYPNQAVQYNRPENLIDDNSKITEQEYPEVVDKQVESSQYLKEHFKCSKVKENTININKEVKSPIQFYLPVETIEYSQPAEINVEFDDITNKPLEKPSSVANVIEYSEITPIRQDAANLVAYSNEAGKSIGNIDFLQKPIEYSQITTDPVIYSHITLKSIAHSQPTLHDIKYNQITATPGQHGEQAEIPIENNDNENNIIEYTQPVTQQNNYDKPITNSNDYTQVHNQITVRPVENSQQITTPSEYIETEDNNIEYTKPVEQQIKYNQPTVNPVKFSLVPKIPYTYTKSAVERLPQYSKPVEKHIVYSPPLQKPSEYNQVTSKPDQYTQQVEGPISYSEITGKTIKNNQPNLQPIEFQPIMESNESTTAVKEPSRYSQQVEQPIKYDQPAVNPIEYSKITEKPLQHRQTIKYSPDPLNTAEEFKHQTYTPIRYSQYIEKPVDFNQPIVNILPFTHPTVIPVEYSQTIEKLANNSQPIEYTALTVKPIEYKQLDKYLIRYTQPKDEAYKYNNPVPKPAEFNQPSAKPCQSVAETIRFTDPFKNTIAYTQLPAKPSNSLQLAAEPTENPIEYRIDNSIEHIKSAVKPVEYSQPIEKSFEYTQPIVNPVEFINPVKYTQRVIESQQIRHFAANPVVYSQPVEIPVQYRKSIENPVEYIEPAVKPIEFNQPVGPPDKCSVSFENLSKYTEPAEISVEYSKPVYTPVQYSQLIETPIDITKPTVKPVAFSHLVENSVKYRQVAKPMEYTVPIEKLKNSRLVENIISYTQPLAIPVKYDRMQPAVKKVQYTHPTPKPFKYIKPVETPVKYSQSFANPIECTEPTEKSVKYSHPIETPVQFSQSFENPIVVSEPVLKPTEYSQSIDNPFEVTNTLAKPTEFSQSKENLIEYTDLAEEPIGYSKSIENPCEYTEPTIKSIELSQSIENPFEVTNPTVKPIEFSQSNENPIEYTDLAVKPIGCINSIGNPFDYTEPAIKPIDLTQAIENSFEVTNPTVKPIEFSQRIKNSIEFTKPAVKSIELSKPIGNPLVYPELTMSEPAIKPIEFSQSIENLVEVTKPSVKPIEFSQSIENPFEFPEPAVNSQSVAKPLGCNLLSLKPYNTKLFKFNQPTMKPLQYTHPIRMPVGFSQQVENPIEYGHLAGIPYKYTQATPKFVIQRQSIKFKNLIDFTNSVKKPIEFFNQTPDLVRHNDPVDNIIEYNNLVAKPLQFIRPTRNPFRHSQPVIYSQLNENSFEYTYPIVEPNDAIYPKSKLDDYYQPVMYCQSAVKPCNFTYSVPKPVEFNQIIESPCDTLIQPAAKLVKFIQPLAKSIEHSHPAMALQYNHPIVKPVEYSQPIENCIKYTQVVQPVLGEVEYKPVEEPVDFSQHLEKSVEYSQPSESTIEYSQSPEKPIEYKQPIANSIETGQPIAKPIEFKPYSFVYTYPIENQVLYNNLSKTPVEYRQPFENSMDTPFNPSVFPVASSAKALRSPGFAREYTNLIKQVDDSPEDKPVECKELTKKAFKCTCPTAKLVDYIQPVGYKKLVDNLIEYTQPASNPVEYILPIKNPGKYSQPVESRFEFSQPKDNPVEHSQAVVNTVEYTQLAATPFEYNKIKENPIKYSQVEDSIPGEYNHKTYFSTEYTPRFNKPIQNYQNHLEKATISCKYNQVAEKLIEYNEAPIKKARNEIEYDEETKKPIEYQRAVNTINFYEDQVKGQTQIPIIIDGSISSIDSNSQFVENTYNNNHFLPNYVSSNVKNDDSNIDFSVPIKTTPTTYKGNSGWYDATPFYLPENKKYFVSNNDNENKIVNLPLTLPFLRYLPCHRQLNEYISKTHTVPYTKSNTPLSINTVCDKPVTFNPEVYSNLYTKQTITENRAPTFYRLPYEDFVSSQNTVDYKYNKHQDDTISYSNPIGFMKPTVNLYTNMYKHHPMKYNYCENNFAPFKINEVLSNAKIGQMQVPQTDSEYKPIKNDKDYSQPINNKRPLWSPEFDSQYKTNMRNHKTCNIPNFLKKSLISIKKRTDRPSFNKYVPYTNKFGFAYPNNDLGKVNINIDLMKQKPQEKHEFHPPVIYNNKAPITMRQYHKTYKPNKLVAIQQILNSVSSIPRILNPKKKYVPRNNMYSNNGISSMTAAPFSSIKFTPQVIPVTNQEGSNIAVRRTSDNINPCSFDQPNTYLPISTNRVSNSLNFGMPVSYKFARPIRYESVEQEEPSVYNPNLEIYVPYSGICGQSQYSYPSPTLSSHPTSTSINSRFVSSDSTSPEFSSYVKLPDSTYSDTPTFTSSSTQNTPLISKTSYPNLELLTKNIKTSINDWLKTNPSNIESIPIGEFGLTKFDKGNTKFHVLTTDDPNIIIKTWVGKANIVKAKLSFETEEVSVINFLPEIVKGDYDPKAVQYMVKEEIKKKYGEPIVIEEISFYKPYVMIDNTHVLKSGRCTILWPTFNRKLNCWTT